MNSKARGVILLCAGNGSRMGNMTKDIPKCLLQVNDKELVIDYILKEILLHTDGEIVAVVGFNGQKVENYLKTKYGNRVKTVFNKNYTKDTNIYSVELGVSSLKHSENGYIIIETDLLLDPNIWKIIFKESRENYSFWVCSSYYSSSLTGGIVHLSNNKNVDYIEYKPEYDPKYLGWSKMIGIMSVGPNEVKNDIKYRRLSIKKSIKQYYLEPWSKYIKELPCKVLQIDNYFAKSFNTEKEYLETSKEFFKYQNKGLNNG